MTANGPPEDAEAEPSRTSVERCEIARWRGYLTSAFYARRLDDAVPLTECSRAFRSRGSSPPREEAAAQAALADVVAILERDGWVETACGAEWFAWRFERVALVEPVAAASPSPVEPEPPAPEVPPVTPVAAPAPPRSTRARDRDGRPWQIAAIAALPAAFALLGWLVAGGG